MNLFKARPPRTMFELMIARGGIVRGSRVSTFIIAVAFVIATDEAKSGVRGGRRTMEQYAEAIGYSEAAVYRQLRLYRELVPEYPDVVDLIEELRSLQEQQRERSIEGVDASGLLPT